MKFYEIKYPNIFNHLSIELSNDRTKGMDKNYKHKNYYWGDQCKKQNIKGVLAEMIAQYYFQTKNINFKALSYLGQEPEVEADIVINNIKIDVKYIPHYGKFLMVNYLSHTNTDKKIDKYMFIQPFQNTKNGYNNAKIWFFDHKEIDTWQVEKSTLTKVFKFIL